MQIRLIRVYPRSIKSFASLIGQEQALPLQNYETVFLHFYRAFIFGRFGGGASAWKFQRQSIFAARSRKIADKNPASSRYGGNPDFSRAKRD